MSQGELVIPSNSVTQVPKPIWSRRGTPNAPHSELSTRILNLNRPNFGPNMCNFAQVLSTKKVIEITQHLTA